jgi:glycosyltransferase involved in cell wall biosynthesis
MGAFERVALPVSMSKFRILVVGQTPPPFGGQAIMIEELLKGEFTRISLYHVRMAFSDDMDSVGKFKLKKVLVLFRTIFSIWVARFRYRTRILYYPPAGPNKVPVLRDIILLCATRWLFAKVVFHFHAGGVSTFRNELPAVLRPFFDFAYRDHTLAIRTSGLNPDDGNELNAGTSIVIPNGIRDMAGRIQSTTAASGQPLRILFTGVLIPSKGVKVLVDAFKLVKDAGLDVELKIMGRWGSDGFKDEIMAFLEQSALEQFVEFYGVLSGEEKFRAFASCDIFCFPSYFEAESFGLVIVEAMLFKKPVVSTMWRGIPSVVSEGVNGYLVPIKDPEAIASRLMELIKDPDLRERMGRESRRIYEEEFSIERFYERMENAFVEVGA